MANEILRQINEAKNRAEEKDRRRNAALWLFIVKNGLMENFKEFYRQYRGCSSELLQAYLMEEYKKQLFATDEETDGIGRWLQ